MGKYAALQKKLVEWSQAVRRWAVSAYQVQVLYEIDPCSQYIIIAYTRTSSLQSLTIQPELLPDNDNNNKMQNFKTELLLRDINLIKLMPSNTAIMTVQPSQRWWSKSR